MGGLCVQGSLRNSAPPQQTKQNSKLIQQTQKLIVNHIQKTIAFIRDENPIVMVARLAF